MGICCCPFDFFCLGGQYYGLGQSTLGAQKVIGVKVQNLKICQIYLKKRFFLVDSVLNALSMLSDII